MDLHTVLVFAGIVVISAVCIALFSLFGIKEKSYEEAIAEQRKLPDDLLSNKKEKNKEKKHKNKAGKKVKEKKEEKDDKDERSEHVQFEDTPQILPPEPPVQESNKGNKKKGKLEKIKPILVNKDEPSIIVAELNPSQPPLAEVNHFDLIHPKDDLELVRSQSINQIETMEKVNKSPKDTPTKSKKNNKDAAKKRDENAKDEKQDTVTYTNASSANKDAMKEVSREVKELKEISIKEVKEVVKEVVQQLPNKEPKKTKKKNDILSQIDGDAINVELLMLCVQKAELSRSEIQILTNQLLNKQQDNPLEHSEWTEGRADPVIKLKKQLAEKEKALTDEHEASVAFQNKLKELRAEFNMDRSRLLASIRQLEESLNAKITETQTLHTRMQHILESHVAEKQGFARQIEQLQTKVNEDATIIHKLQEDQGQTQGHLQQELMAQRKQMEVQFAQMRDNENALKSQLAQKHVEMQELQNELQATCESSTAEIEMLRQQLGIMQGQLMHSEGQLQHFKEANDRLQDVARQLEESHRAHADLDHRLKSAHRHEQELQKQVNSLQAELNHAKNEANETPTLKLELSKTQTELMKLKSELSATMNEAKSEAAEIIALKNALSNKEDELKRSQDKFYSVQNDLQQSGLQVTRMESELNSVQKKLDILNIDFEKTECNLKEAKNDTNKYQNQIFAMQEKLANSQMELVMAHDQLRKSNERTSEFKALQTELNRLQSNEKKTGEEQFRIIKLQEENDRLRTELASALEKQRELQQQHENKIHTDVVLATAEPQHANSEEKALLEKLKIELTHKEEEFNKINERLHVLESDANKHQYCIRQLEEALEVQKSKNNELRTKNWKVMEALSAAESRAKSNDEKSVTEVTQKIKEEQEETTKAFLQRIFPEIKVSEKTHEQWLKSFEDKICTVLSELKQKNTDQTNPDLERQNKNLQGMVSHYKQIIYDTEGMLNKLQSYIESEETRWQSQLRQKENEVANLRVELNDMQAKLISSEESKQRAKELEARAGEYDCSAILLKSAQKAVASGELDGNKFVTLEQLQEEKARLSQELEVECNKRATLDAEVTKLRSLVETSEASLVYEKNLVTQLQQEVSQLKNEICGGCSSSEQSILNGPPTSDSLQSERPIASQALITALENTLLKNTEFANCSITKPVNLVSQSEQEIENNSLTTKYSSKSCHMTDHNTQANWNPMIGQQHKKHKKKRKGGSGKK
ncbi:PREDICTED: ribosome-binding protein 1-like isoform X3 [Wasmannia auropunctata]|uniref:ribosome-binding protein 1-like isoform X3 n=1 Tax=Wasmannia auropunctata TaxID=64793 RepID=UPI0005EF91D7|nr:PREDICTED: ribosome-binding protein 1-like isoform X3 [Wasmannia auropunctata]